MDPISVIHGAEFLLPPEFLTDEDFHLKKENMVLNGGGIVESNKCLSSFEKRHGFGSTVKANGDEENFLAGMTRQTVNSTLEDEFSRGFCSNHAFPLGNDPKAWITTRPPLCTTGIGCGCRNQRLNQFSQSRVSSQAASWDLYCAAAEEVARMNINDDSYGYSNHIKRSVSAAKKQNSGSGYDNHLHSLTYQKLQAIQFQQLKQQQLMKHHRQLVQQSRGLMANSNKNGRVDLSTAAWSNQQPRRDGSTMRAVFLDQTGKRNSTGTGVFLPRRVNHSSTTTETRKIPTLSTVLVPTRVAQVLNLNLDDSVVQPVVRSSASLNEASLRQRSNNGGFSSQMKMEQTVNEPRLPLDWAY